MQMHERLLLINFNGPPCKIRGDDDVVATTKQQGKRDGQTRTSYSLTYPMFKAPRISVTAFFENKLI